MRLRLVFVLAAICLRVWANESVVNEKQPPSESSLKSSSDNYFNAAANDNTLLVSGVTFGIAGSVLVAGSLAWWMDKGMTGTFSWKFEGFFGEDTYSGGADKVGHFAGCYGGVRALATIYDWLGVSTHEKSTWLAAGAVFLMTNGVELVDAFSPYGFSYEDVVFNTIGIGLAVLGELNQRVDELIGFRFSYFPSRQFIEMEKGTTLFRKYIQFINDYTGIMVFFDFKFAGVELLKPTLFQYLLLGVDYSTVDYSPAGPDKQRNLGVHLGVNFPRIIENHLDISKTWPNVLNVYTKYFVVPFTNIGFSHDFNSGNNHIHFGIGGRLIVNF